MEKTYTRDELEEFGLPQLGRIYNNMFGISGVGKKKAQLIAAIEQKNPSPDQTLAASPPDRAPPPPPNRRNSDKTTTRYSLEGQRTMPEKYQYMINRDDIDPEQREQLERMARRRELREQEEMKAGVDVLESARQVAVNQKEQELEDITSQVKEIDKIEELDKQIQGLKRRRAALLESKGISHSKVSPGILNKFKKAQDDQERPKSTKLSMDENRGGGKRRGKKGKTMKRKAKKSKRRRRRKSSRTRRR